MISDHISEDIPLQMKTINMVVPFLMLFCSGLLFVKNFVSTKIRALQAACHQTKCDVIFDFKIFPTVYIADIHSLISNIESHITKSCA